MRARFAALPTLLLVLAGVLLATRALDGGTRGELGSLASKLAQAERVVVYALTPTDGPRFRVPGGPQELLLLLHLELPPTPEATAPPASYRFGVIATLRGPDGGALWERTLTLRTRQTRSGRRDAGWDHEAAFVPGGQLALSDSGSLELAVPGAPEGAVLELRLAPEAGALAVDGATLTAAFAAPRALVRAYRKIAMDASQVEIRRLALAADGGARQLGVSTYLPWYALSEAQQRRRLGVAWERLAAEGRAGIDYQVRSVYVVPPLPPAPALAEEPALTIGRGQPVVVQLHGPGTVTLRAWPLAALPAGQEATVELRLRRLGPELAAGSPGYRAPGAGDMSDGTGGAGAKDVSDGTGDPGAPALVRTLALRAGEVASAPQELAGGWWSLELHTGLAAAAVQVLADAPERHAGPDDHTQHSDAAGRAFVPVDLVGLPVYAIGPAAPPLPIGLAPDGEAEARLVQVDLRAWGTLAPVLLRYSFVDAAGAPLAEGTAQVDTTLPAPFERLRRPGEARVAPDGATTPLPGDELQAAWDPPGGALGFPLASAPVSAPVSLRLLAPPGATLLRLSTGAPALVAVHGRLPPSEAAPELRWTWPYDQVEGQPLRWLYAPRVAPPGFPRRADDHVGRAEAGQLFLIQAQVRAEATTPVAVATNDWQVVAPRGSHARLRVLERVPGPRRAATLAGWGPGDYLRLRRGASETVNLAGRRPARAWYQASGPGVAVVGADMAVSVGDQPLRWRVTSPAGHKALPGREVAELRWLAGPAEMIVMIDRPPARGSAAPLYQSRQVHRLGAAGLTVAVAKPAAAAMAVNVVVYWLAGAPRSVTRLAVEIDGGSPRRRAGAVTALTPGRRTLELLPTRRTEVVFSDRRGLSGAGLARFGVILGDDLAPGKHTLRVIAVDGPPVWLRLFRAGTATAGGEPLQWNERRDGLTLEDSDAAE